MSDDEPEPQADEEPTLTAEDVGVPLVGVDATGFPASIVIPEGLVVTPQQAGPLRSFIF